MSKQQQSKHRGKNATSNSQTKSLLKNTTGPDGQKNWRKNGRLKQKSDSSKNTAPPKKSGLPDIHQKFLHDVGLNIYAYARSQGYSVYGALLFLALAAQESGYGNNKALNKALRLNNFFGIDAEHRKFTTQQEGIEYELEKNAGLIHRKYPLLDSLLRQDNPELSQLDKGFKGYNLDANGKNYATWLSKNIFKGLTKRALNDISDELANLQNELSAYKNNLSPDALYLSKAAPFLLNNQDKFDLQAISELKAQIDRLTQMQQELQTGRAADTNYFTTPHANTWYNKNTNNTDSTATPLYLPVPLAPELQGAPVRPGLQTSYYKQMSELLGNGGNAPNAGDVSFLDGAKSRGGGVTPVNNINYQSNENYYTNTTVSQKDIHDQVVAVLTSAVADAKIGTDVH